MPRISVLMPVYNGMPYITEAVESVLAQEEQNWELVISDNGSTDSTRAYLSTLRDPRIRVHLQQGNLGIFGNMNFLMQQTQASIAKILCADDKLLPDALTKVAEFMEERPWCALSRCWGVGDVERFAPHKYHALEGALPSQLFPQAAVLAFATFGNLVGNLSKAACRPQMVQQVGSFNQQFPYAGDYEAWTRVAMQFGIGLQNVELIFERIHNHQNSVLLNKKNEIYPQLNKLLEILASKIPERERSIIKRHWTIHFLAPRLSRSFKQILAGEYRLARGALIELPLNISAWSVVAAYLVWKFNFLPARTTTRKLSNRILELNQGNT